MSSIVSTPLAGGEQPTPLDQALDAVKQGQVQIKAQLQKLGDSLDRIDELASARVSRGSEVA